MIKNYVAVVFAVPVKAWCLALCCCVVSLGTLSAQKEAAKPAAPAPLPVVNDSAVQKLFDPNISLKWIKRFKGRIDDVYLVDIVLGYDDLHCRGYLTYVKSKVRFKLEGTLLGEEFRLEERDPVNLLTGTFTGTLKSNDHLAASWANHDNSIGSILEADPVQPGQTILTSCGENKWVHRYITRYNGARADMVLLRANNGALDGFLWIEADARSYSLKGDMKADSTYEMEALLPSGKTAGLLQGSMKKIQAIDCNWIGSGERRTFNFTLKDKLIFGCLDYADYRGGYDAIFPRTSCVECNNKLEQITGSWMNQCRTTVAANKDPLNAASRNTFRATAWPEIVCWTESLFTGYLNFTESWNEKASGKSINFDLKAGKEITYTDLFNKGFDAKVWLEDFARRESPKLPQFAADPKFREWVSKEGFPLFALRRDGLELATVFHPVYGQLRLLAPWSELKPYMKKDNPVAEFVK